MTDPKDAAEWSDAVGSLVADALVTAGIVEHSSYEKAAAIATKEILVRLSLGDYPPPINREQP